MTSPSSSTWDNFPVVFGWRIWTKNFQNSKFLLWQWMLPVVFLGSGLPLFTAHLEDLKCCFVCVRRHHLWHKAAVLSGSFLSVEIVKVLYAQGQGLLNAMLLDYRTVRGNIFLWQDCICCWSLTVCAASAGCLTAQATGWWPAWSIRVSDRLMIGMVYMSVRIGDGPVLQWKQFLSWVPHVDWL